ncbi:hypothetical protein V6N11_017264 [Hibiscus sabdariffa]|uniref:Secreted protein n=1 Tax=Hibiscus sabdariffa TaxID=183260 RepID=A0ABR2TXV6_9ROSI
MTALWFWWCLAYMAVYVSVARLLKGPLTRPYPCPWSIGLFSLSGNDIPYGFGKTRSLPVLFRCLPFWLRPFASNEAPPLRHVQALHGLCARSFVSIEGTALATRWLLCGIAPSPCYLAQQDAHAEPLCQGIRAL